MAGRIYHHRGASGKRVANAGNNVLHRIQETEISGAYAGDRYEILNEIDRLSTVGANNDKSEQISRKIFGDLTGLAMSVLNDDRV
jgi:hypothetical protein